MAVFVLTIPSYIDGNTEDFGWIADSYITHVKHTSHKLKFEKEFRIRISFISQKIKNK